MRNIPVTMGTQHPDNAGPAFWDVNQSPFISAYTETVEAYKNFADLDVDEYMWDWEGKHADAAVVDRLFSTQYDYFKAHELGRDKFITFRFPNIWEEEGYSLMQAMTTFLSAEDFAHDLQFASRPLFEAILPMAQSATQLIEMQDRFEQLAHFKRQVFTTQRQNHDHIEMIPLFENFQTQLHAPEILREYLKLHAQFFGNQPEYLRVFLAGSDSALSSGFMNAIIGNKLAIARLYEFAEATHMPVYPIVGMGSAIFRGGLSPRRIDRFVKEFAGVRTVTVQSAFRYDYPLPEVQAAIAQLKQQLPKATPLNINAADQAVMIAVAEQSARYYRQTLDQLIPDMQPLFKAFPKRRDRRQHIGVLGYGRAVDGQALPRAINFTGSFYAIGVPPEFIGFGRALAALPAQSLGVLVRHYPDMQQDFAELARYVNLDSLAILAASNPAWHEVEADIQRLQEIFGFELAPKTPAQQLHHQLAQQITQIKAGASVAVTALMDRQAQLRHFLG